MNKAIIKTKHPIYTLKYLLLLFLICNSGSVFSQEGRILGDISLFAGDFVPREYMACDGTILTIEKYTQLFSVIGETYGGDIKYNFGLPNMLPPIPGMRYIIAANGIYPLSYGVMETYYGSLLGEVMLFTGDFIPDGWMECNGQSLNVSAYDALYSILGTTYGGVAKSSFMLPNLAGPNNTTYIICVSGLYPSHQ